MGETTNLNWCRISSINCINHEIIGNVWMNMSKKFLFSDLKPERWAVCGIAWFRVFREVTFMLALDIVRGWEGYIKMLKMMQWSQRKADSCVVFFLRNVGPSFAKCEKKTWSIFCQNLICTDLYNKFLMILVETWIFGKHGWVNVIGVICPPHNSHST